MEKEAKGNCDGVDSFIVVGKGRRVGGLFYSSRPIEKGPLRCGAQRSLLRTTECLGDRWDGVTSSAVRDVRTPLAVELFCDVGHSCDNIGSSFRLTVNMRLWHGRYNLEQFEVRRGTAPFERHNSS